MRTLRPVLYGLLLLLVLLAAGAVYYYPRLPALLEQQAEARLYEFGVRDIDLGELRISLYQLGCDRLRLQGERDGLAFDVTLSGIRADYEPGGLWKGAWPALSLDGADIIARETAVTAGDSPAHIVLSEFSPRALVTAVPLSALRVAHWSLDYQPLSALPVTASGALQWSDQLALSFALDVLQSRIDGTLRTSESESLQLSLDVQAAQLPVGKLTVDLAPAAVDRWRWTLQGELGHAPLLAWLRRLGPEEGLALDLSAFGPLQLQGRSGFQAEISHPDELRLPGEEEPAFASQFQGRASIATSVERLTFAGVAEQLDASLSTSAVFSEGELALTLGPAQIEGQLLTAALQLPEETLSWLRWGKSVPLRWRSPADGKLRYAGDDGWSLQLRDNSLLLGDKSSQLKWQGIQFDGLLGPQHGVPLRAALSASVDTRLRQRQLPQMQLALEQERTGGDSGFQLLLRDTARSLQLSLDGSVSHDDGFGGVQLDFRSLDLPYAASVIIPLLQKFELLQEAVELDSGSLTLDSDLRLGGFSLDQLEQQSQLLVEGVSGSYGEYRFEGIELAAAWKGVEQWQTLKPVTFSVARLDPGFDVVDTRATLSLPQPTSPGQPVVRIATFESGMFGGRVFLPRPARWDFGSESNSITLRAEQWRLADMVALQAGQDIQARGILEGELPITVSAGRIIIEKGYLRARAPGGSIRYHANAASQALAASSPELGLAMELLEDFQYQTLSSEVELDRAGNLLLGLSLEGSNPARYEGRPIRFNINLEQNLDPLLQSLRLSDSLVEKVEKGLR